MSAFHVINIEGETKRPICSWTPLDFIEKNPDLMVQLKNLSNLPFLFKTRPD